MLRAIEKWPNEPALVSKDDEVYTFMEYYQNAVKHVFLGAIDN